MSALRRWVAAAARSGTPLRGSRSPTRPRRSRRSCWRRATRLNRSSFERCCALGWQVTPAGRDDPESILVEVSPRLTVTGHPDATGFLPPDSGTVAAVEQFLFGEDQPVDAGSEVVIEVKTRGPEAFKRWQTLGAKRSHPDSVAQAACYSLGLFGEVRDVVIVTLDTGSRRWNYEVIPECRVERAWEQACRRLDALADHKWLNALLEPERRAEIVTEQTSEYLRVS